MGNGERETFVKESTIVRSEEQSILLQSSIFKAASNLEKERRGEGDDSNANGVGKSCIE